MQAALPPFLGGQADRLSCAGGQTLIHGLAHGGPQYGTNWNRKTILLGVDLGKLTESDARLDAATGTAYVHLPAPEVLSTRFDEPHSYVHARATDLLAKRNEALESVARRDAIAAFETAAKEPKAIAKAKEQAEKQLRALAKGWGARELIVTWGGGATPAAML